MFFFSLSFSSLRYKVNLTSAKKQEKHTEVKYLFFQQTFFICLNSEMRHHEEKLFLQEFFYRELISSFVFLNAFRICIASVGDQ